jgi:phage/plasmid primase-like uncharacterized protein
VKAGRFDTTIHEQFKAAMMVRGIIPPEDLEDDGSIHRCDVEGDDGVDNGKGDGTYLLHCDGIPAGGFCNWRDGLNWENWRADIDRELTDEELQELQRQAETDREKRETDIAARYAEAAQKAAEIWSEARPCTQHPYLDRKHVQAHRAHVSRRADLVIPMYDAAGVLTSLQFIAEDGRKRFLTGGRVSGCRFGIGGQPIDTVLIGEGFATCASAHEATGYPVAVAFNCGNLVAVAGALRLKYPATRIVFLADDDHQTAGNPGLTKAREAAAAVGGVVAIPDFGPNRPHPAKDFNDLALHLGAEAVKRCIEAALGSEATEQPDPTPATEKVREFPTLAEEAYIGLAGEIVRLLEPHTEADPAGLLLSLHIFFGNCIGRGPYYLAESTEHGPNLYLVKVGDTSKARKGTSEDRIRALFRFVDEDWVRDRTHGGLSSGEGVIWEVRDPITKLVRDRKTKEVTEEIVDPGERDKRLLVTESEFAGALRVMQRQGNTLSKTVRELWDRPDARTMTKTSPARTTGSCVSIIGHITAPELRTYLDRTEMANGFGNRFLYAGVRRSKLLPFGGRLDEQELENAAKKVWLAVEQARIVRRVDWSPDAAAAWEAIYAELSAPRPGLLGELTARAEAQVVRLALIYALWDGTDTITEAHLLAAVGIEDFSRKSVEYVFGDTLGDQAADTILAALRAAGSSGLTRTDINNLLSRSMPANQIARALGELSSRKLAVQRKGATSAIGGRPPEIWTAV